MRCRFPFQSFLLYSVKVEPHTLWSSHMCTVYRFMYHVSYSIYPTKLCFPLLPRGIIIVRVVSYSLKDGYFQANLLLFITHYLLRPHMDFVNDPQRNNANPRKTKHDFFPHWVTPFANHKFVSNKCQNQIQ